jgi:hypothetical protein
VTTLPTIDGQDRSLAFETLRHRVQAEWRAGPRSCKYHATIDGRAALCGAPIRQDTHNPYPSVWDPSDDIMTCDHCAARVRRIRQHARRYP